MNKNLLLYQLLSLDGFLWRMLNQWTQWIRLSRWPRSLYNIRQIICVYFSYVFKLLKSLNWQLYPEWHYSEVHYGKSPIDALFKCLMFLCDWCRFQSQIKLRRSCHNPALISIECPIRYKEGTSWLSQKCVIGEYN